MQNDIVSENPQSTVVAQYERTTPRAEAYQSEAELEQGMIAQLQRQGYEYAHIHHEDELIQNLRQQLEKLNDFHFSDNEWERFFKAKSPTRVRVLLTRQRLFSVTTSRLSPSTMARRKTSTSSTSKTLTTTTPR